MRNHHEFPKQILAKRQEAKTLEIISIIYLASILIAYLFVLGHTQIIQAMFSEDILSLIAPISFLVANKYADKKPTANFPFGFHKIVSIAFFVSAISLTSIGAFLLIENSMALIKLEHPKIPFMSIFGFQFWMGYLMLAILAYKIVIPSILGHIKIGVAKDLHDKILYTDAKINKADWMSAGASFLGIIAIGQGYWWADASVALLVSIDILFDGLTNLKHSLATLMDQLPKTVEREKTDPLIHEVKKLLKQEEWISDYELRVREAGHIYFIEAFITPKNLHQIMENMEKSSKKVKELHWKIFDFNFILTTPTK